MPVYFIRAVPDGPIKIGWSRGPAAKRLSSLQVCSPMRLELLGEIKSDRGLEQDLHALFSQWRMWGDWFEASPHVLETIGMILAEYKDKAILSWTRDVVRWVISNKSRIGEISELSGVKPYRLQRLCRESDCIKADALPGLLRAKELLDARGG